MRRVPVVRGVLPHGVSLVLLHDVCVIDLDQSASDAVIGATALVRCVNDMHLATAAIGIDQ